MQRPPSAECAHACSRQVVDSLAPHRTVTHPAAKAARLHTTYSRERGSSSAMMGGLLTWSGRLLAPSWCLLLVLLACRACLITAARACACRGDATQCKEVTVAQDTRPNTYGIMPFTCCRTWVCGMCCAAAPGWHSTVTLACCCWGECCVSVGC